MHLRGEMKPLSAGRRFIEAVASGLAWLLALLFTAWAAGALFYDLPPAWLRAPAAIVFTVAVLVAMIWLRRWRAAGAAASAGMLVLAWWLTIAPSNEREWQGDVAQAPWAEIDGDRVTLHNVRHFEHCTETDYTPRWETRTLDLTTLRGVDLFINYWGSPYTAHPIVSFDFGEQRVCFSIETRKEVGESYSAIGGIYRQYELVYVAAQAVGDAADFSARVRAGRAGF